MFMATDLEVLTEKIQDGIIIRPVGEIDLRRAPSLRYHLQLAQRHDLDRIVLDLSDVTYVDSAVVAILVEAEQTARSRSGLLVLCGLQELVRSVFQVTRLYDGVFSIVETLDQALALPNRRLAARYAPRELECNRGEVLDISHGGARIGTRRKLRGRIDLRFYNDLVDISVQAHVRWSKRIGFRRHQVGVQFMNMTREDQQQLAKILDTASRGSARAG